jgi:hypothetical protein
VHPGELLARVEAEGHTGVEGDRRILAEEERAQHVRHFNGAVLHGVEHLQRRHDLARGGRTDREAPFAQRGDAAREVLRRALHRVEAFRPHGGHAPARPRSLRKCGGGRQRRGTDSSILQKIASFHRILRR